MKRAGWIAVAFAALSAAAPVARAQAPAVAMNSSATPSPEKMALARAMLAASGGQVQAEKLVRTLYSAIDQSIYQNLPPEQRRLATVIQDSVQTEVVALIPAMLDASARVYAENLTDQQLRDYTAFLESDTGRAIRDKLPVIQRQTLGVILPMMMAQMPAIMSHVVDQACVQAKCTAQDRQVVAAAVAKAMQNPRS